MKTSVQVIQLVDEVEDVNVYDKVRNKIPHVRLVQVIHVADISSIDEALKAAPHVDALLLDSGNPKLLIKELGGTGRVHDWSISSEIVMKTNKPVFLAGGLNPKNVGAAITAVQPFGVDVCSGLRVDGKLNEDLLIQFVDAVKN